MSEIFVLTGPESCGKTTLATSLCEMLRLPLVPELSRDYLNQRISNDGHYQYSEPDLLEIARKQFTEELHALSSEPEILICDTDLLVLVIWSEVRFGHCHQWILDTFAHSAAVQNRYYLLCDYHVPWEPDPLRENADSRKELFQLYQQKLDHFHLQYSVIAGDVDTRIASVLPLLTDKITTH